MIKKSLLIGICMMIALFFTSLSFSQDDPSIKADEKATENAKDAAKDTIKDDKAAPVVSEQKKDTATVVKAKTFSDGKNLFVNSKVMFRLFSKDNLEMEKIEYKVDGGEVKSYDSPFVIEQEGRHTIHYWGIDKTGNKEEPKRFDVIIDNTAPNVTVVSSRPVQKIVETKDGASSTKIFISKDITFTVNSDDNLSGVSKVQYSLNGKDFQDYVTPFKIFADGDLNLQVRSFDNVNNYTEQYTLRLLDENGKEVDLKDANVKFAMDNNPPTVTIKSDKELKQGDNRLIASSDVKYSVQAVDAESGIAQVLVRIDRKGEFVPYAKEIMFLTNGDHVIEAKAVDKVGNVSNTSTLSVFVDMTPPDTLIETVSK